MGAIKNMKGFNSNIKNSLKEEFLKSIQKGLGRKTINKASSWSTKYRIMDSEIYRGPWDFKWYPWLKEMHDSDAELNVGAKAAQVGFTETLINIAFYHIDVNSFDVLYVLPSRTPDASDFSAARFDSALELSPYLENLFSDTKNIGHKRAGSANFYLRGSKSRAGLKSIPVNVLFLDELNEMNEANIPLALERLSGQREHYAWMVSTPTIDDSGISKYFNRSSQNIFYFRCPSCSRFENLEYPDNIVFTGTHISDPDIEKSHLICKHCKNVLYHEDKVNFLNNSKWIESYSDRDIKGWHISQLYSMKVTPAQIATSYFAALQDPTSEQEFYNSKLGLTHEVKGSRITDSDLERVIGTYLKKESATHGIHTMGVDVGYPSIHYEIDEWSIPSRVSSISTDLNFQCKPRVIAYGKVREMEELDHLMHDYHVRYCVIDAHPERRKAYEFSSRFYGKVRLAFYATGITGKQIHISNEDEPTLSVDRTSWLDLSLGRFKSQLITLPANTDLEYKDHLKAPVRQYKKDRSGNPIGEYINVKADHYAHARNYAEIALPLALSLASSQSIGNIL